MPQRRAPRTLRRLSRRYYRRGLLATCAVFRHPRSGSCWGSVPLYFVAIWVALLVVSSLSAVSAAVAGAVFGLCLMTIMGLFHGVFDVVWRPGLLEPLWIVALSPLLHLSYALGGLAGILWLCIAGSRPPSGALIER